MSDLYSKFYSKTRKRESGCLEWVGAKHSFGYGQLRVAGKLLHAHRLVWEMNFGKIPKGLCVLHHCDNPSCVEITHLFLGSKKDNMDDKIAKGRDYVGNVYKGAQIPEKIISAIKNSNQPGWWLAETYQVSQGTVSMIRNNKIHKRVK